MTRVVKCRQTRPWSIAPCLTIAIITLFVVRLLICDVVGPPFSVEARQMAVEEAFQQLGQAIWRTSQQQRRHSVARAPRQASHIRRARGCPFNRRCARLQRLRLRLKRLHACWHLHKNTSPTCQESVCQ